MRAGTGRGPQCMRELPTALNPLPPMLKAAPRLRTAFIGRRGGRLKKDSQPHGSSAGPGEDPAVTKCRKHYCGRGLSCGAIWRWSCPWARAPYVCYPRPTCPWGGVNHEAADSRATRAIGDSHDIAHRPRPPSLRATSPSPNAPCRLCRSCCSCCCFCTPLSVLSEPPHKIHLSVLSELLIKTHQERSS